MKRLCLLLITLMAQVFGAYAQAPKAKLWVSPCEDLCVNLIAAIQRQPAALEMRLEDALVMQESCAADIVVSAMCAVQAEPDQVRIILQTALKIAPQRSAAVRQAMASYKPASLMPAPQEEIRRAELPDLAPPIEIRRAELPDIPRATKQ